MIRPATLIVPAHDEAGHIVPCLDAVLASDLRDVALRIVVVANGCTDDTASRARRFAPRAAQAGCDLRVIATPQGGKLRALQLGDAAAGPGPRLYLDADVIVGRDLIRALAVAGDQA